MTWKNFYLGDNELIICEYEGDYRVMEKYENYSFVAQGSYAECMSFCRRRIIEYLESLY